MTSPEHDPRILQAAWVLSPSPKRPPGKVMERLEKEVLNLPGRVVSGASFGQASLWRQGRRVIESIYWVHQRAPARLSLPSPSLQAAWALEGRQAHAVPQSPGSDTPWPTLREVDPPHFSLLESPATQVALSAWRKELEAIEPAPSWVYWALRAEQKMLHAELAQCAWSESDIDCWWGLVEGLLGQTFGHGEIQILDGQVRIEKLPVSEIPGAAQQVLRTLGAFLPPSARRPARLSALSPSPEKKGSHGAYHQAITDVLRQWVPPARLWTLRRTLQWTTLTGEEAVERVKDFKRMRRPAAYRALEELAQSVYRNDMPQGLQLPLLEEVHRAAPKWPGWKTLLETLDGKNSLTLPLQATLHGMRRLQMEAKIPKAPSASSPLSSRRL